jgi:superfamily II DNA helicase RecQ
VRQNICKGEWQIVLISPEIILSKLFIKEVVRDPAMASRILSVVVDEAHVISHWGASFRKQYAELGILRAILPKGTPFVAMSATLAPRVRRDVLKKLQFDEKNYANINIGNDRPNISIVVRGIQNPMNTLSDLDFVIPIGVKSADDIPKTFIYANQISAEVGIETQLTECLPPALRDIGLIRPFSAAFSPNHRQQLLALFKVGIIQILICTDAAGIVHGYPRKKLASCLLMIINRDVTYQTLMLWFNGNFRHLSPHSYNGPGELVTIQSEWVLRCFSSKSPCTKRI